MKKSLIKYFYIIIVMIVVSIIIINKISKRIRPIIYKYAEIETKKFSNYIINKAISDNITKNISNEEIFIVEKNAEGEIKTIDFNTKKINKYLAQTTKSIERDIKNIEKGNIYKINNSDIIKKYNKEDLKKGIVFYISTGLIFNNPILNNLGPKIPIKINIIGDIISYISTDIKDYGINNSLIKVYINLKVNENMIMPFSSKDIIVKAKIPIGIKMITGKIPELYYGNKTKLTKEN